MTVHKVDCEAKMDTKEPPTSKTASTSENGLAPMAIKENGLEEAVQAAPERAAWGNQAEFILTMVGYAVGLGNVWRFPYLCYKNGGGAFLIPYFGTLALVGLPLFFLELAFGQFVSLGPIAAWTLNPLFKGLGWAMIVINTMIAIYYNVIISWTLFYFFASMNSQVPWSSCGNWWNTDACSTQTTLGSNSTGNWTNASQVYANITAAVGNHTLNNATSQLVTKTPSEEFFYRRVLQMSDGFESAGTIVWPLALCLLLSWTIVFLVLIKGISSLGKVVYFSSIFPYVVLTIMLIRGVTLPGAIDGILYYLKPDFSRLSDARAWSDAATQIFFSLSTCTGGLSAMASYNPFRNNCLRDAILIPIINCCTSFYGGFAIFSVLGYMAHQKGATVREVAASGPGLVFVVFPEALQTMPVAPIWSILFFVMLMTLGFSSEFSIVETTFSAIIDEFPTFFKSRRRCIGLRLCGIITFYLIGLSMVTNGGFYLFNLFDSYVGGFPLLIVGLFECIAINHIYGYSNFAEDIKLMLGKRPTIYIRICWCLISPLILFVIIIFLSVQYATPTLFSGAYVYPSWAEFIGWLIVLGCIISFPGWFTWKFLRSGGLELLKKLTSPTSEWGPASPADRTGKYACQKSSTAKTSSTNAVNQAPAVSVDSGLDVCLAGNSCHGELKLTKQLVNQSPSSSYLHGDSGKDNSAYSADDDAVVAVTSFRSDKLRAVEKIGINEHL